MSTSPSADATFAACLTPAGAGAIATLAVRGPHAWSIARELFRAGPPPGRELSVEPSAGRHWLGRLGEDARSACADEVILVVKRGGPAPWIELHSHGGREVVHFLLDILSAHGARVCPWQELEQWTSDNASQAAAAAALVEAPTVRTAAILLDQYHGAFASAASAICAALGRGEIDAAMTDLTGLAERATLGRHLTTPWRMVVAGPPNVGKSSLVNALAGFQRSVVAATPGTTRDVVTTQIAIDGWPVELTDTAGIRATGEDLEQLGIARARAASEDADLCLWVLDASSASLFPTNSRESFRYVVNKIDLPVAPDFVAPKGSINVSAARGDGLGDLCGAVAKWLVPDPPLPGAPIPFTPFLCDRVEEALRLCAAGDVQGTLRVLDEMTRAGASVAPSRARSAAE